MACVVAVIADPLAYIIMTVPGAIHFIFSDLSTKKGPQLIFFTWLLAKKVVLGVVRG